MYRFYIEKDDQVISLRQNKIQHKSFELSSLVALPRLLFVVPSLFLEHFIRNENLFNSVNFLKPPLRKGNLTLFSMFLGFMFYCFLLIRYVAGNVFVKMLLSRSMRDVDFLFLLDVH